MICLSLMDCVAACSRTLSEKKQMLQERTKESPEHVESRKIIKLPLNFLILISTEFILACTINVANQVLDMCY